MNARRRARLLALPFTVSILVLAPQASADDFVIVRDDGSIAASAFATSNDVVTVTRTILDGYETTGSEVPDVISVWFTFPMGSSTLPTFFVPFGNDVRGIGLERLYGGDGTFASSAPPLRAMLLHNSMLDLPARAARHDAPLEGYAEYLFLLELSHLWGPEIAVPGVPDDALIGFHFHWSFYLDAGGGPAGGNVWIDNHDGTFTTGAQSPSTVRYSMLDLYLLGLAASDEVPPFGLLTDVVVPTGVRDPINGRAQISSITFPWFGSTPVTVQAARREVTIDDVIAANGARAPAAGDAPATLSLGVVLVVGADISDAELASARAAFAPIAASLAPAFRRATHDRGTLELVTSSAPALVDAGVPDAGPVDAGHAADASTPPASTGSCSASTGRASSSSFFALLTLLALVTRRARRH